ncbi:hypothetical protein L208DRAFT_1319926, partial [Tricholoma matsutake]
IDVSNHYLTPIRDAQDVESIPFDKGIDPHGILQDMARGDGSYSYIHTEDNQDIILFKQTKTYIRLAMFRFDACEPQMFHIGDIVQLQLSFVTVPVKEGGHQRMLSMLQSIALLKQGSSMVRTQLEY